MSAVFPPDASQVLQNHQRRLRALEAVPPGGPEITVTDGIIAVDPLIQLDIDGGHGIQLADLGGGEASLSLPVYHQYTPVLSAVPTTGTNPFLGNDISAGCVGFFTVLKQFVHTYGFGSAAGTGVSIGTGIWQVSLPILPQEAFLFGIGRLVGLNGGGTAQVYEWRVPSASGVAGVGDAFHIVFSYCATPPLGTLKYFDHTSGWSLSAGDSFEWNIIYKVHAGS